MYSRSRTPASQLEPEHDPTTTPASAKTKTRRKSNSDGLLLTKSGRVSMITNEVNAKYDASYRNSDNTNKLLGRSLTLGQACGLIGVALYGADIPLEDSGSFFAIIYCLFNIFCIFCIFQFTLFIFIL